MNLVETLNEKYMKSELPELNVGDTVRVTVRVKEGNRERNQVRSEEQSSTTSETVWARAQRSRSVSEALPNEKYKKRGASLFFYLLFFGII